MSLAVAVQSGWEAMLQLHFALNDDSETVLASRLHKGPLVVQKPLYPEGKGVCHVMLLHPPGGVAGGDSLSVNVTTAQGSHALMTTPGAGKWYKSNARLASQSLYFRVGKNSVFEWLPQETILFNGAEVHWQSRIELEEDGCYMGWEIVCFGRSASGEKFSHGSLRQETEIFCEGKRIWGEYASVQGGDKLLSSATGLAGRTVAGTFLLAGAMISDELLKHLRAIELDNTGGSVSGISRMGKMVAVRYLGHSSELARQYFSVVWSMLRPAVCGRVACMPRIWNT
jgi:urease accessory protein